MASIRIWVAERYDPAVDPARDSGHTRRPPRVIRAGTEAASEAASDAYVPSNPTEEPAQILAISAGSFPDVVAYPEHGYAWVATRDSDPELLARGGDPGIITRFEIPIE